VAAGTKIDNLVQIAHNVQIGRCCFICACCGIAGSTVVEDGAVLGGQVGIRDHVTIGAGAQLAGSACVYGNVPAGATYGGCPARPHREHLYIEASLGRLPDLLKTVRALEKRVAELEADAQARGTPDA
jgi:UDP-3-O-[3-hydroxymyristoyl] glucosamine N-acyltransferase